MTVLVGYASAHGSTREIAERIGERIRESGRTAEVRPLDTVGTAAADGYDAFVIGSAVHDGSWLAPAADFVKSNHDLLARRPVWIFSVGMPAALRGPWKEFAAREEPLLLGALGPGLQLRGHRLFSGVIARDHLSHTGVLLFRLAGCRFGDYRDWAAVEAWAADIVSGLSTPLAKDKD